GTSPTPTIPVDGGSTRASTIVDAPHPAPKSSTRRGADLHGPRGAPEISRPQAQGIASRPKAPERSILQDFAWPARTIGGDHWCPDSEASISTVGKPSHSEES